MPDKWKLFINLRAAYLSGAVGIVVIQSECFTMYIQADTTTIGCKTKTNEEWLQLDIDTAVKMGIKREHFEAYHAFFKAAMLILNHAGIEGRPSRIDNAPQLC